MFNKKLYFTLITLLVFSNVVCGKKTKRNKRPKDQEDTSSTTIQPNVVAYSTFGFNDVGSYDGFVPTSPDYATFLSGVNQNQESSTRLYAPAFPSSLDSSGFGGNYGPQTFDGHSFGGNEDNVGQTGMLQYSSSSMNFFNNPSFGTTGEQNKNIGSEDTNGQNADNSDAPVYGTKINSRHKYRAINPFNNTELNVFNNGYTNLADEKYLNFPDAESTHDSKPSHSESNGNYQNGNINVQNYDQSENEDFGKPASSNVHNMLKFPRVVDFTNLTPYPTELDTSKFFSGNNQPLIPQNSMKNIQNENTFSNTFNYNNNKFMDSSPKVVDHYNMKSHEESTDKSVIKSNSYFDQDITFNHVNTRHKSNAQSNKPTEQKEKKKTKHKPSWSSGNYSNDFTNWKDSSIKGYGYSTNYSNMNFKYDVSEPKKPFNPDEIVPASSNVVDLTNYHYPETDYSHFKKLPELNEDDDDYSSVSFKDKTKASDYLNQFKNSFSTVPTTTSYWGTGFKTADYSSFRDHPKKTHYSEINSDSVVNIPKRPHKLSYTKAPETKLPDWPHSHHSRPHKLSRPTNDWQKDLFDTRYKSEEDLLGLRTHDTSHPTYLPTFKPSNNVFDNDNEFKNLVEKWRQSYLKTKYKDVPVRDYESYGSEQKPLHVPIPKPYPIEVAHPVIVPVPRPFPVRVPVSRPVAVPVLREITVPIVKPVPYPVYKKVPYPVEKLVPVPVEKEVAVPVEKPYPVHIPYVRPVFHHTKPVHEDPENIEEDDYMRRPEIKKPSQYKKRPYGTRNRSRRPSRASYQDSKRRRWPDRRRPSPHNSDYRHHSRPSEFHSPSYKHRDYEREEEEEHSDYALYCRRTGNC